MKKEFQKHGKAKTRREFIGQSFMGVIGSLALPSFGRYLFTSAHAQGINNCSESSNASNHVPYLCFDGVGGMNIAGDVIVGFARGGGQLDYSVGGLWSNTDYLRLGLPASMHPNNSTLSMVDNIYGLAFHRFGGLVEGLNAVFNLDNPNDRKIVDGMDGIIICARTADDTANNPINAVFQAKLAGAQGELVNIIGTGSNEFGGRSVGLTNFYDSRDRSSRIQNFGQAQELLSIGRKIQQRLDNSPALYQAFFDRIKKINQEKINRLPAASGLAQALNCSVEQAREVMSAEAIAALGSDSIIQAIQTAPIGVGGDFTNQEVGATLKMVVTKQAGAGTINVGSCDYHDGTNINGHNRNRDIGIYIAQAIKYAAAKEEDLFIHLFTDGGVGGDTGGALDSSNGKVIWTNDSGTRSSALCIVYKHNNSYNSAQDGLGRYSFNHRNKGMLYDHTKRQIGNFVRNGGVDRQANSIADTPDKIWMAVMLNYLNFMKGDQINVIDEFQSIFQVDPPPDAQDMILIKPKAA